MVETLQSVFDKDGYLAQVGEQIPVISTAIQFAHTVSGNEEALDRAISVDPMGSDGFVTRVFEHLPLVNDGIALIHDYKGCPDAAERARARSLSRMLSRDGAVMQIAELMPGSNLLAAAVHAGSGDNQRALVALWMVENWQRLGDADGPLAKAAELIPGTDAFVFLSHMRGGRYELALRSLAKTRWVRITASEFVMKIPAKPVGDLAVGDVEAVHLELAPSADSLVYGARDMFTHYLEVDEEGSRRNWLGRQRFMSTFEVDAEGQRRPWMDSAECLTRAGQEKLLMECLNHVWSLIYDAFQESIPPNVDWAGESLEARRARYWWSRMLLTGAEERCAAEQQQVGKVLQGIVPRMLVTHGPMPSAGAIRLRGDKCWSADAAATAACGSGLVCAAAAPKLACAACATGLLLGVWQLGGRLTTQALEWLHTQNLGAWTAVAMQRLEHDSGQKPPSNDGVVVEFLPDDMQQLNDTVTAFIENAFFSDRFRRFLARQIKRRMPRAVARYLEPEQESIPVVMEYIVEERVYDWMDEWGLMFETPQLPIGLLMDWAVGDGDIRVTRMRIVIPDAVVEDYLKILHRQLTSLDFRRVDPRFAGFTKPVFVACDLDLRWGREQALDLVLKDVLTTLSLPE